jgi:cytochrome c-type biogenesis protein CcmF
VTWIWFGCILMALGGFTALTDRRYRVRAAQETGVASGAAAHAG